MTMKTRSPAKGVAEMPGIDCDLSRDQTNIAYFRLKNMHATDFLTGYSGQGCSAENTVRIWFAS